MNFYDESLNVKWIKCSEAGHILLLLFIFIRDNNWNFKLSLRKKIRIHKIVIENLLPELMMPWDMMLHGLTRLSVYVCCSNFTFRILLFCFDFNKNNFRWASDYCLHNERSMTSTLILVVQNHSKYFIICLDRWITDQPRSAEIPQSATCIGTQFREQKQWKFITEVQ